MNLFFMFLLLIMLTPFGKRVFPFLIALFFIQTLVSLIKIQRHLSQDKRKPPNDQHRQQRPQHKKPFSFGNGPIEDAEFKEPP